MPAITQKLLLAEVEKISQNPAVTSSIDPGANKLILCLANAVDDGFSEPIVVDGITGAGLTWVKIGQVQSDTIASPRQSMAVFRALGPSPSAGVLSITFDRTAGLSHWIITEFDNIDIGGENGADAIVQFKTNVAEALATIAATMDAFGNIENATVGCFASGADPATTWVPGSGFGLIAEAIGEERVPMMEFRAANETNVEATQGVTDHCAVIGIELKSAGQAPPPPPPPVGLNVPSFMSGNLIT